MDNSETHYIAYDPEEIWDEMHKTYLEAGGDILYPGDEKEILLRAVLAIAVGIMAKVDSALRMDTLAYAQGEYLKLYGEKRSCAYIEAIAATAPVTITFQATGNSETIEAGTALTADGLVIYETTEDIEKTGYDQIIETTVRCQTAGTIGNGLNAGAQLQFIQPVDGAVTAIVNETASGGVDAEDEEVYRERIRNWGLASVTTGASARYEAEAMAVSTDILDAKAVNEGGGEVGVYLIFAEGASKTALINSVNEALSATDVRPLTDHVTVKEADEVAYTIQMTVYYSERIKLNTTVQETIEAYQKWQDNTIGRAFNPDKLTALLYQSGVERVVYGENSGMDGSMDYQAIAESERCVGTITPTIINNL